MTFKLAQTRPATKLKPAQACGTGRIYITLGDACFGTQYVGVSRLLLEWVFANAPRAFSVQSLLAHASPNYVLAVRSKGKRFKFWTGSDEVLSYSVYDGETLYEDTVFELWSTLHATSGDFSGFTFYLTQVLGNHQLPFSSSSSPIMLSATYPGRVALCSTPTHTLGPAPHPTLIFSNTTSTCPP